MPRFRCTFRKNAPACNQLDIGQRAATPTLRHLEVDAPDADKAAALCDQCAGEHPELMRGFVRGAPELVAAPDATRPGRTGERA